MLSWGKKVSNVFQKGENMTTEIMVSLPDEVYQRAERLAQLTGRDVTDILAMTIECSLPQLKSQPETVKPVATLSDEEVITLATMQMEPRQSKRLSLLLERQREGGLTGEERTELQALLQYAQERLLRKAQALQVAVQRGRMEPLHS